MPELPDIAAYISALEPRIVGQPIARVRLASPFLLRTAQPPITSVEGRVVRELRRIGKRIAIGVEGGLWLVLHLMIAGRLHWRPRGAKLAGRRSPACGAAKRFCGFATRTMKRTIARDAKPVEKFWRIAACPDY
jgi:formamidopyrimidine-DNA glycosylase